MINTNGFNPATGEWNDSLTGNFLWSNTNIGETLSDVLTPFTWSLISASFEQMNVLPQYPLVGNIGGRAYNNVSVLVAAMRALGRNIDDLNTEMGGLREDYKENLPKIIPSLPKPALLPLLIRGLKIRKNQRDGSKNIPTFLTDNPEWCRKMFERIPQIDIKSVLADLASGETLPYALRSFWMVVASAWEYGEAVGKTRRKLIDLVSTDEADSLLSSVSNETGMLASLGPVVGLMQLERGEISRSEYLESWGHRGPHESEISIPRPSEDPEWLDQQLAALRQSPVDVDTLLANRRADFESAWARFQRKYPREVGSMQRRLEKVAQTARAREAVRSELVRVVWVARTWGLRAGQLSGLREDIFFLTIDETISLLRGEAVRIETIAARRETYARYQSLPPYPLTIRGHFDPFQWAADPNRRSDFAETDGVMASIVAEAVRSDPTRTTVVYGAPGSAGVVEGFVRRVDQPEEGDQLQPGEILVTKQTNIGWSYLFPLAKAIVTDVGAALSHAAIVARELGIPAVVNCGDATMRLRTGDRVRVDGSAGTVTILSGYKT
jgi:phosphohistidine swiveling domain-containing protein